MNKIKVVSFQSAEVLNKLLTDGVFWADAKKSREGRDYRPDIDQLGCLPVWLFAKPDKSSLSKEDFMDGTLLEKCRCEMSLRQDPGLSKFYMLELEIDPQAIKVGLTHNACDWAFVKECFTITELKAVYQVIPTSHFYYKAIRPLYSYTSKPLFTGLTVCANKSDIKELKLDTKIQQDVAELVSISSLHFD